MTNLPPAENAFRDIAKNRMPAFLAGIGPANHPSRLLAAKRLAGCESILDVGCGPGIFLATLNLTRRTPFTYVGTDPVEKMTELAKQNHGRAYDGPWRNAPAENLPFPDETFDGVLVRHVFEHLEDPGPAMREAGRICARDLVIVFSQWTNPRRSMVSDAYLKAIRWSHHDRVLLKARDFDFNFLARYRWGPRGTTEACSDRVCDAGEQLGPREELWHLSRNSTASLAALELARMRPERSASSIPHDATPEEPPARSGERP